MDSICILEPMDMGLKARILQEMWIAGFIEVKDKAKATYTVGMNRHPSFHDGTVGYGRQIQIWEEKPTSVSEWAGWFKAETLTHCSVDGKFLSNFLLDATT